MKQVGGSSWIALAAIGGLACACPAAAQDERGADASSAEAQDGADVAPPRLSPEELKRSRQVYPPTYFSEFAPRNAFDMLERVPGFSVEEVDEARGLGQASGNVLINGARLSSKTETAEAQLKRINAGDVERIEIVDGATLNMPGLSGQIANVIVRQSGFSGQFAWDFQAPNPVRRANVTNAELSVSASLGPADVTLGFTDDSRRNGSYGPDLITAGDGTLIDKRQLRSRVHDEEPKVNGAVKLTLPGLVANLRGSYLWNDFKWRRTEERFPVGGVESVRHIRRFDRFNEYELGGDLQFPLGPGQLKLIGLYSGKDQNYLNQAVLEFVEGVPDSGDRYDLDARGREKIARAEYSWPMLGGDWQLSAEAAFNSLENVAGLFEIGPQGDFVPIPFPAGTGGVAEDRYESILSYGRPLTDKLSLQLAVGAEYSKLVQTGSNAEDRSFRRPKGSVSLAWAPRRGLDLSLRLSRKVGQLEFSDFLAEVFIGDDNANAGNNQLVPEQSWEAEFEISKDLGPWGTTRLKLQRIWIQDVVTFIPQPGGGESPGNVDHADRKRLTLDSTFKSDPLGLPGGRLDLLVELEDSAMLDPVTHILRPIDSTLGFNLESEFREDIPATDWAFGFRFEHTDLGRYYRVFEVGEDDGFRNLGEVYVEHKNVAGLTVRATFTNLFYETSRTYRTVYDGPRDVAPVLFHEKSDRQLYPSFDLSIRGNF